MELSLTVYSTAGVIYESTLSVAVGLPEEKAWSIVENVLDLEGIDMSVVTAMDLTKVA